MICWTVMRSTSLMWKIRDSRSRHSGDSCGKNGHVLDALRPLQTRASMEQNQVASTCPVSVSMIAAKAAAAGFAFWYTGVMGCCN